MTENAATFLETSGLGSLKWDAQHLDESLQAVQTYTVDEAERWIDRYQSKSQYKKWWAYGVRIAAVVFAALGVIIPIVAQIGLSESRGAGVNPGWASIALALAAIMVGLERYFGFSAAWMRCVTTKLTLTRKLRAFMLSWELEKLSWQGKPATASQAADMLTRCSEFLADITNTVQDETRQWVLDLHEYPFRQQMEGKSRLPAPGHRHWTVRSSQPLVDISTAGALAVQVENGDQCEQGWTLAVEGRDAQTHRGRTAAVTGLDPGLYKVSVTGELDNRTVEAECIVVVAAGEITPVTLTLT